jgi:hypothetical protein
MSAKSPALPMSAWKAEGIQVVPKVPTQLSQDSTVNIRTAGQPPLCVVEKSAKTVGRITASI